MSRIQGQIGQPGADLDQLAAQVSGNPAGIREMMEGLKADQPRLKFGCAKVLRLIGERRPELLYPHFDAFVQLLGDENKILQWEAVFVLSHLARVDKQNKFEAIFERYFAPIAGPTMITAGNIIGGAARIALARPEWADRVATQVLAVRQATYQTAECRNVAIGHAIRTLGEIMRLLRDREPALQFVREQLHNTRAATRKKAVTFLKKHDSAPSPPPRPTRSIPLPLAGDSWPAASSRAGSARKARARPVPIP
jgi:hypothetical protein